MQQNTLKPRKGSTKRHKRRGIGDTFAGKGVKGQKARVGASGKYTAGFEGGQISLVRRMPKLGGFRNPNRVPFQPVNLTDLEARLAAETADATTLHAAGLIKKKNLPIKLLATGTLKKKLTVKVDAASAAAKAAVEKAGGTVEILSTKKAAAKTK
jgi:large subunit ribosomal protein L15